MNNNKKYSDDNVYRKLANGRYQAFGVCYQPEHLPDGLWFVRHHDHGRAMTSVPYIAGLFRVGNAAEVDVPVLCGLEEVCEEITNTEEYHQLINNSNGYCINDIIHYCVKYLYDKSQKEIV